MREERQRSLQRAYKLLKRRAPSADNSDGVDFVLSDATPDRFGDMIEPAGWDLTHFKRNPVALFEHRTNLPIGRWHYVRVDKTGGTSALKGCLHLAPAGTSQFTDEIRQLVQAEVLRATSVAFVPIEERPIPGGGRQILKAELHEISLVAVPANSAPVAIAKSLRISAETLKLIFLPTIWTTGPWSER